MPAFVDKHPSGSILAANARLYIAPLPPNSRVPVEYTLTAGAVALGAETIGLTSTTAATLVEGATLTAANGNTVELTASATLTANTASSVAIKKATAVIAASTEMKTINARLLRGVQNIGRPAKTNLISIRSMESGLGNEQRPVMLDFTMPVDGWIFQGDEVFAILEEAAFTGNEIYAILESPDNKRRKGAAIISNLDQPIKIDDVMKFSVEVIFQGIPERETIAA